MELYAILEELGIVYDEIEHPPVFTVEEAQSLKERIDGVGCKNLLLTDNRREKFFLVVLEDRKKADLKEIAHLCGTSRLTFANAAELNELLIQNISKMPPQRQLIFRMSRCEHLSNREIAERLGLSVRSVDKHIELALKDLHNSIC